MIKDQLNSNLFQSKRSLCWLFIAGISIVTNVLAASCMEPEQQAIFSELTLQLNSADQAYIQGQASGLTDAEYDSLKLLHAKWANCHKNTQPESEKRVTGFSNNEKVMLAAPMGSLHKVYQYQELLSYLEKMANKKLIIQPKLDGVAIELIYHLGLLQQAATRGNGEHGQNVLPLLKLIRHLPSTIPNHNKQVIRGELLANTECYQQFKSQYSSPRQLSAAMVNSNIVIDDQVQMAKIACLSFYPYHWLNALHSSDLQALVRLTKWGFSDMANLSLVVSINSLQQQINKLATLHNLPTDGVVIKLDERPLRSQYPEDLSGPGWALALKNYSKEFSAQVLAIDWRIGRTGKISPVMLITPITINGRNISRIPAYSLSWLQKHKINQGALITVIQKGQVMAQLKRVLLPAKKLAKIPDGLQISANMPLCLTNTPACKQRFIQQMAFSLKRLGVTGIRKSKLKLWLRANKFNSWEQLFVLQQQQWQTLLGEQTPGLITRLQKIKSQESTLSLLQILGPKGLGKNKLHALATHLPQFRQLSKATLEHLQQVPGIGTQLAGELFALFNSPSLLVILSD